MSNVYFKKKVFFFVHLIVAFQFRVALKIDLLDFSEADVDI